LSRRPPSSGHPVQQGQVRGRPSRELEEQQAEPSPAAIARHLRISEAAVRGVQLVKASANVVGLDPGGSDNNPFEDVQMAKVSRAVWLHDFNRNAE
jgi:hypothetical protein